MTPAPENLRLFPIARDFLQETLAPAFARVLDDLNSEESRKTYRSHARCFYAWHTQSPWRTQMPSRDSVGAYKAHMQARGRATSSVNSALSVVRQIVSEAAAMHLMTYEIAGEIARVKLVRKRGVRIGHWLSALQMTDLLGKIQALAWDALAATPLRLRPVRDAAILAVFMGSGLRRREIAGLKLRDVRLGFDRWALVDIEGKGGRIRTVPIPEWTKAVIDAWTQAAGITSGHLFRKLNKRGLLGAPITSYAVAEAVQRGGTLLGLPLQPHDLRRSFARAAYAGGASMEQLQLSLGHANPDTTIRYLGKIQNFEDAPCDRLGIVAPKKPAAKQLSTDDTDKAGLA